MSADFILRSAVAIAEGITASALQNYKSDDRNGHFLVSSREEMMEDFNSFDYADDVHFDASDNIFEEFTVLESEMNAAQDLDLDMETVNRHKWKEYRVSAKKWFILCVKISLYLTIISSWIGIFACAVMFVDINTADLCSQVDLYSLPRPYQQVKVVSQAFEGHESQYFHLVILSFTFGIQFMHKLRIIYVSMCAAFCDTLYRLIIYIFELYDQPWKSYPLNVLFISVIIINSFKVANYLFPDMSRRLKLVTQIGLQFVFGIITLLITFYILMPWFIKLNDRQRLIVASISPIIGTLTKICSRMSVKHMANVTHPGNLYILSIAPYMSAAVVYRTFQADIESTLSFSLLCLLHGVFGLLERVTVLVQDHFYQWFYKKILKRENFQSRIGLFKKPKTQRYMADLTICQIIHEHIAVLYCNAILQLYPFVEMRNSINGISVIKDFGQRCLIASSIEYAFNVMTIYVLTRHLNIPLVKLWRKRWKTYAIINSLICFMLICYTTQYLLMVPDLKYNRAHHNSTKQVCNVSQLLFFN